MKTIGLKTSAWLLIMKLSILSFPPIVHGQSVSTDMEHFRKFDLMPTDKGLIQCRREERLKSDVDPKAFEKWIMEYWNLEWQDLIPGIQPYFAKREHDINQYAYFLVFNSKRLIKY